MDKKFNSYLGLEAILAAGSALGYAYFFLIAQNPLSASLFLLLSGLFATKVMVGLFVQLRDVNLGFALLALVFGVAGSLGMAIHGGYDLANVINPPMTLNTDLPSQLDPRGILAFGSTGLAMLYISWLMSKASGFPKNLSLLGIVSGALLVWIYVARLTVLDPTNPMLLYPVLIEGFIINPLWYLWLAVVWKKTK